MVQEYKSDDLTLNSEGEKCLSKAIDRKKKDSDDSKPGSPSLMAIILISFFEPWWFFLSFFYFVISHEVEMPEHPTIKQCFLF